jgi:hypothetical protein
MGFQADATIGIVEARGTDHVDGTVGVGTHGWVGAHSAMSSALVGVIVPYGRGEGSQGVSVGA